MARVAYAIISILLLNISAFLAVGVNSDSNFIAKGDYYLWKASLKAYDISKGRYEYYWTAAHYVKILDVKSISGDNQEIRLAYYTLYEDVNKTKYSTLDTEDRIHDTKNGNAKVVVNTTKDKYLVKFANETWGFKINFPIVPFMIFNVKSEGFLEYFKRNFMIWNISEEEFMERGILFDTWDIIIGSKRDVYYVELFYRATDLNFGEYVGAGALPESSIVEANIEIDKKVGIVLKIRYFLKFADKMFELLVELTNTNKFAKNVFIYTLIIAIGGIIAFVFVFRFYRKKARRRLIRI